MNTALHPSLTTLGIDAINAGACHGAKHWSTIHKTALLTSTCPSDGSTLAQVSMADNHDYETVIAAAGDAFQQWRDVPAPKRGELIRVIGEKLRACKDTLGSLVALEMGKSKQEGDGEVQEMIDMADFAVGQSRMLYGQTMHSERYHHRMMEQWHPLGIVGVISAFNFPVAVWAWNAFIGAICGNTIVWKPSLKTPLCTIAVQHICNAAMSDLGYSGIFSMVIGDTALAKTLIADPRIALVSFTGSSQVGREVNQVVAARFGKCLLELSGNNAIIVSPHANLALAVPAIVFGAVGTAGQRCTTTRRLFIHESLHDELLEKLTHAYKQIRVGSPLDPKNLMGPLIDQAAVDAYLATIAAIKTAGGKIITGGQQLEQSGFYVTPTIATAHNDWAVVQQETFAPILYVMSYKTLDEAIALQNTSRYGLSSALFSDNIKEIEKFLSAVGSDCGIANINIGTSGAEIGGAFGGEKETGGGREAGSDAWKAYMRRQTNTINWSETLPLAQGIKFEL